MPHEHLPLPPTLTGPQMRAVVERIDRLNRHENDFLQRINDRLDVWLNGYLAEVNQKFYSQFVNTWDLPTAKLAGTLDALAAVGHTSLSDLGDDLEDEFTDQLQDGETDGWRLMLWDLRQQGLIDDEDLADAEAPTEDGTNLWMLLAGIGGLSILDRLRGHIGDTQGRTLRTLRMAMGRGMTLTETQGLFETLGEQMVDRFDLLATAELQRVWGKGQRAALAQMFGDDLAGIVQGEIWVSRRDGLVCPICQPLDGLVTSLQPVDDSHPGCRCIKVPLFGPATVDIARSPVDLDDFLPLDRERGVDNDPENPDTPADDFLA